MKEFVKKKAVIVMDSAGLPNYMTMFYMAVSYTHLMPHKTDWTARFLAETCSIASFVVITGFTINLIPRRKVINTEKLPMVAEGTRLDT